MSSDNPGMQGKSREGLFSKYAPTQVVSILLMVMFVYINGFATPALAAIAEAFPGVDMVLIQEVVSLPSLTSIIGSLMVGAIAKLMSRKKAFIIAMFVVLGSGVLPGFVHSFELLIACKALIGIGTGMSLTLSLAFVPALFEVGPLRDRMFGLGTSIGAITGIFVSFFGGYLATFGWNYPFFGSLITIPFIIIICAKLPDPGKAVADDAGEGKGHHRGFTGRTWALLVLSFIAPIFFFALMTNMALAIAGLQLGDPAIAGTVLAMYMIATTFNGIAVPVIKGALKKFYFPMAFLLFGIAFLILVFVPSLPAYFVAAFIFGLGFGMYNVEFGVRIAESCAPESVTTAMSLFTGLGGVGQFLSPILLSAAAGAFGLASPVAQWTIAGPCLLVIAVVVFVLQLGRKQASSPQQDAPGE